MPKSWRGTSVEEEEMERQIDKCMLFTVSLRGAEGDTIYTAEL